MGSPANGVLEVAGPQQFYLDDLIRDTLRERHDAREVIDRPARALLRRGTAANAALVPADGARLAATRLDDWQKKQSMTGSRKR